jgi:hypothetical protein
MPADDPAGQPVLPSGRRCRYCVESDRLGTKQCNLGTAVIPVRHGIDFDRRTVFQLPLTSDAMYMQEIRIADEIGDKAVDGLLVQFARIPLLHDPAGLHHDDADIDSTSV